jgi:hypothetical protein
MRRPIRQGLAFIATLLWMSSFFLPAVRFSLDDWELGSAVAVMGWAGPFQLQFGWYGNLVMIPALGRLAFGELRLDSDAWKLGLVLFLLWVNALFWTQVPSDPGPAIIAARGSGYYAWMASLLIVWLGLFVLSRHRLKDMLADEDPVEPDEALDQDGAAAGPAARSALHDTDPPFQIPAAGL